MLLILLFAILVDLLAPFSTLLSYGQLRYVYTICVSVEQAHVILYPCNLICALQLQEKCPSLNLNQYFINVKIIVLDVTKIKRVTAIRIKYCFLQIKYLVYYNFKNMFELKVVL